MSTPYHVTNGCAPGARVERGRVTEATPNGRLKWRIPRPGREGRSRGKLVQPSGSVTREGTKRPSSGVINKGSSFGYPALTYRTALVIRPKIPEASRERVF